MRDVRIALNICTYHRERQLLRNLELLLQSRFFDRNQERYYGRLHIYVVDNASTLRLPKNPFLHLLHNRNTGGSGGFQKGLERIRTAQPAFTHVVFMDDDVTFRLEAFYLLYDFLVGAGEEDRDRPVAGRMLDAARPTIQWTAAEIWNGGDVRHIEFLRDITKTNVAGEEYRYGRVNRTCEADYGGWWFCCYPMSFAGQNDILPFFLHCDDVEYGLRCGKRPILIEGVQVWHETWEKKMSPAMVYYDTRNALLVNERYGLLPPPEETLRRWKEKITKYHVERRWAEEYAVICGLRDFLKGMEWLYRIDAERWHKRISGGRGGRIRNAVAWRVVERRFRKRFGMGKGCENG